MGGAVFEAMHRADTGRAVDGRRAWADGVVGLAHQHFRLRPEEREEDQPILSRDGELALTCDARLDGRDELKRRLGLRPGDRPSDAQLILAAYDRWSTDCVKHLEGDFACILWDRRRRGLFCARDPLGVRDLAYHLDRKIFVAASTPAQVAAHPAVSRRINEGRLAEYLAGDWQNQAESFFADVAYCPPGHCLWVTADANRVWQYWDLDLDRTTRHRRAEDYADEFRDLLTTCVTDRLDVAGGVAISLSGGPDSAALAALVARAKPQERARSFSYVFDRFPSCDERQYIQPVVERLGLHATLINGDRMWPLSEPKSWPVLPDFPAQDPYARLPLAVASAAAAEGRRVVLNGHYSDVLLHGGRFWAAELLSPRGLPRLAAILATQPRTVDWRGDILRRGLASRSPRWLRRNVRGLRGAGSRRWAHLSPELLRRTALEDRLRSAPGEPQGARYDRVLRARHLLSAIGSQGASAARRIFNAVGVEVVDPFWDRRLVELVTAYPADVLAKPRFTKWVLREAVRDLLPAEVAWRRDKTSLYELYCEGLLRQERETVSALLARPLLVERGFVRRQWLRRELELGEAWDDFGYTLWRCVTAEMWLNRLNLNSAAEIGTIPATRGAPSR